MTPAGEAKDIPNRTMVSGAGRRCAEYTPSLDELKSTTFSDYVRGEILGVPLPGYEFLYVYEDKEGRETKREVPVGQVPILCPETGVGATQPLSSPDESTGCNPSETAQEARMTRSLSKAINASKDVTCPMVAPPNISCNRPDKYRMCWYKLRDGMAKVTLPTGFWAKNDTTARGRHVSFMLSLFSTIP
jgi:hypothetical protein